MGYSSYGFLAAGLHPVEDHGQAGLEQPLVRDALDRIPAVAVDAEQGGRRPRGECHYPYYGRHLADILRIRVLRGTFHGALCL